MLRRQRGTRFASAMEAPGAASGRAPFRAAGPTRQVPRCGHCGAQEVDSVGVPGRCRSTGGPQGSAERPLRRHDAASRARPGESAPRTRAGGRAFGPAKAALLTETAASVNAQATARPEGRRTNSSPASRTWSSRSPSCVTSTVPRSTRTIVANEPPGSRIAVFSASSHAPAVLPAVLLLVAMCLPPLPVVSLSPGDYRPAPVSAPRDIARRASTAARRALVAGRRCHALAWDEIVFPARHAIAPATCSRFRSRLSLPEVHPAETP